MPNTLAHVGLQGIISRTVWRDIDPKWVYVGCLVPDVPWILQRAGLALVPVVDPFTLRLYVEFQASLVGSLLMCACLSIVSVSWHRTFAVLSANAFLHLLLDSLQIKWGNGVQWFAPLQWRASDWGLFWPESTAGVLMTLAGLVFLLATARSGVRQRWGFRPPRGLRLGALIGLTAAYFLLPLIFLNSPDRSSTQLLQVMHSPDRRTGKFVEMDRAEVEPCTGGVCLAADGTEHIRIEGYHGPAPASISAKGFFDSDSRIHLTEVHVHWPRYRDGASYLALILMGLILLIHIRQNDRERDSGNARAQYA